MRSKQPPPEPRATLLSHFFFNDTATTEIYTLSLHDALPISNAIVMEMGEREVLPVVKETPVIAGVNGTDPTRRMSHFLRQVRDMGFSGVNNFPTVGLFDGSIRQELEETGLGFYREVEMIRIAREMELFTITYTCSPAEARMMAEAGADAIITHG